MAIIVSACLLGEKVRYNKSDKAHAKIMELMRRGAEIVSVCPEMLGGLPTPRPPAEISSCGRVLTKDGCDLSQNYDEGAQRTCAAATANLVPLAILKEKSPACGVKLVYDGTHTSTLIPGSGVAAKALMQKGVHVMSEVDVEALEPTVEHPIALILGSGLAKLSEHIKVVRHIPYTQIEDFPQDARPVEGHIYEAQVGTLDGVPVVVYPGRVHLYQGYSAKEVTSLVRHAHKLGCRSIVLSCASGALAHTQLGLAVHTDQINLTARSPLMDTKLSSEVESPFTDMSVPYHPYFIELCKMVAAQQQIPLHEAIYAGVTGPAYETPAEAAYLEKLGATHVGMSMVLETIQAKALGMNVLGLTLATNHAGAKDVSHQDVLEASRKAQDQFQMLVRGFLTLL